MLRRTLHTYIFALMMLSRAQAQDFINGINLYNRAHYDSVIYVVAPEFMAAHPQQQGLARYFVGESYYNKALAESDHNKSKAFFESAWNEFSTARNSLDLKTIFKEYRHAADYKLAWCSYRLAEMNQRPIDMLKRAAQEFLNFQPEAPDSIKLFSYFMAAECTIRENVFKLYRIADGGSDSGELTRVLRAFDEAGQWLSHVVDFPTSYSSAKNLAALQNAAAIRRETLNYYRGKSYQMTPAESGSDVLQTALSYFTRLNYDSLLAPLSTSAAARQISYLNLMKQYHLQLLNRTDSNQQRFLAALSKLKGEMISEGQFRLAGVYQCTPETDESTFNQRALAAYDSASAIAEADYWMANIFMIENDVQKSRQHFLKFIKSQTESGIGKRLEILFEDAQIKKNLLDFETHYLSGKSSELRNLASEIGSWSPNSESLLQRNERLNLLIHLALANNSTELWSKVLSGSDEEKLQQALDGIMFIVSRVALNIGVTREKYIALLNPLFEIIQSRRIDDANFLRGIVKTLEAEIQARPDEKIAMYKTAATILSGVSSGYGFRDEADYVRGICLFYAEDFDHARAVFLPLINQQHNLRALFYMAEIFRLSEQGRAARECYQAIVTKLKGSHDNFSEYWLGNAIAGIASVDDSGDLSELAGIDVDNIEFLPPLNAGSLIFERLADESFLRQQSTRESSDMLAKFALPQKEIYPSKHVLKNSLFVSENIFRNFPHLIDELRGALTSTLKLTVIVPPNLTGSTEAVLNGEPLESREGAFYRSAIPLNSEYDLVVRHPGCYEFHQLHKFAYPGEERKVVVLTKKITLTKSQTLEPEHFTETRWDGNFVLNSLPSQPDDSELVNDFKSSYELRDVAFDQTGKRFLAVNAKHNSIWLYSQNGAASRSGTLSITMTDSLNSPEGIAIDFRGNFYLADWGNHRIIELDEHGRGVRAIGKFGSNAPDKVGQPIRLVFPTRVAILEDREGVRISSETFYRESYLFVADQNGIHICNLRGEYLDTVLSPNENFPRGSFYGFAVARERNQFILRTVNRSGKYRGQVFEYADN